MIVGLLITKSLIEKIVLRMVHCCTEVRAVYTHLAVNNSFDRG